MEFIKFFLQWGGEHPILFTGIIFSAVVCLLGLFDAIATIFVGHRTPQLPDELTDELKEMEDD